MSPSSPARSPSPRTSIPSLEVELGPDRDSHFYVGLSGKVTEGGVFVATFRPLRLGSLVDLSLVLPDGKGPLLARGVVRWARSEHTPDAPCGMGVQLVVLGEEGLRRIEAHLEQCEPLFFEP